MKKSILLVVNNLRTGGGAQRVVQSLTRHLISTYNIELFIFEKSKEEYEIPKEIKKYYLNYKSNSRVKNILKYIKILLRIKILSKNHRIIISFLEEANLILSLFKLISPNKKVILTIHNNPLYMYNRGLHKYYYKYQVYFYRVADLIVPVCRELGNILIKNYSLPSYKVYYIYNPTDIKYNTLKSKGTLPPHIQPPYILFVGRHIKQKGIWFLLRVFRAISQRNSELKLVILGKGELTPLLKKFSKILKIEDKVYFEGKVENPFPYIKNANMLVLPSLWEGLGMVLLEAISLKTPVIATDCKTGPREILQVNVSKYPIITKNGILIAPLPHFYLFSAQKSLLKEEKMLQKAILYVYKKRSCFNPELPNDFKPKSVIERWSYVLNLL